MEPAGHDDVLALSNALRDRYREDRVSADEYARTRLLAWGVRAAAAATTVGGLVAATVLAFWLGPELGAIACITVGCSSVFAPLLISNRVLRRLYARALRRSVVDGGASFAQPFAIPAALD